MFLHRYERNWAWRLLTLATLVPIGALCVAAHFSAGGRGGDTGGLVLGLALLLGSAAVWVHDLRSCVRLYADRIEQEGFFGTREVWFRDASFFHRMVEKKLNVYFIPIGTSRKVFITVKGRHETIKINSNFKNVTELRDRLIQIELDQIRPVLQERYRAGADVAFGKLVLQRGELIYGRKRVPIRELLPPSVEDGCLVLKATGKWRPFAKLRTDKVGNMIAFLDILKREIAA